MSAQSSMGRLEVGLNSLFLSKCSTEYTESWNHLVWEKPLSSPSPTITPALPSPSVIPIPRCYIQTFFKTLQEQWIHHFRGQPVPVLDREWIFSEWTEVLASKNMENRNLISFPNFCQLTIIGTKFDFKTDSKTWSISSSIWLGKILPYLRF